MRKGGRSRTNRFIAPRSRSPPSSCRSYGAEGGVLVTAKMSAVGIVMAAVHVWSGRLLKQEVYPWWLCREVTIPCLERCFMDFFVRPGKTKNPVVGPGVSGVDVDLQSLAPTLAAYLGMDCWPDGEVRQRSSLVIFYEDGVYKVCLSDKNTSTSLWASSKSFHGLPEALEGRLTEEAPDWRKSRPQNKRS